MAMRAAPKMLICSGKRGAGGVLHCVVAKMNCTICICHVGQKGVLVLLLA